MKVLAVSLFLLLGGCESEGERWADCCQAKARCVACCEAYGGTKTGPEDVCLCVYPGGRAKPMNARTCTSPYRSRQTILTECREYRSRRAALIECRE